MKIAVIPGDGIGPEVITQALRVLTICVPTCEYHEFDYGARRYLQHGTVLTDADLAELKNYSAILLGALGDPRVPSGILERGFLLKLRFAFDQHVNLRPAFSYPGVATPITQPCDLLVVREGTEGPYVGNGGAIRVGTPEEIATEVSINTRFGIQRVVDAAFARAVHRRKKVTLVHKTNVLTFSGSLWERTVTQTAQNYPEVSVDYCHVDAATIYLVTDPGRFDVIVTDNLFGDIITDLAAAITGGIGLAASANIDSTRTYPSMFEPVHGSAPDIAGKNIADPTAAILSVALMLEHLNMPDKAQDIRSAVAAELENRCYADPHTLTTDQIADRVIGYLTA